MFKSKSFPILAGLGTLAAAAMLAVTQARADFITGDAANFAILFEGTGGNTLNFSNSSITGNVGIGDSGKWADAAGCSGQCQVMGVIEFSAADTGQFSPNAKTTYTPALSPGVNPLFSQTNVATDLTTVNMLSTTLGAETPTGTANISGGGMISLSGTNNVLTTTLNSNFTSGTTFTINGAAGTMVVFNIPTGNQNFNGRIVLTGGITAGDVLFNLYGTGQALSFSMNGATTTGTWLDPNGAISINSGTLDGELIGGDSSNLQFVSGANIVGPVPVPAPLIGHGPFVLLAIGGVLFGARLLVRRKTRRSLGAA